MIPLIIRITMMSVAGSGDLDGYDSTVAAANNFGGACGYYYEYIMQYARGTVTTLYIMHTTQ